MFGLRRQSLHAAQSGQAELRPRTCWWPQSGDTKWTDEPRAFGEKIAAGPFLAHSFRNASPDMRA